MRTLGRAQYQPVPPYSIVPPPEVKCYSEFLRKAGYYCTNNHKEDYQFVPQVTAWDESSGHATWKSRPAEKPFFAIFNIVDTHEHWNVYSDPLDFPVNTTIRILARRIGFQSSDTITYTFL